MNKDFIAHKAILEKGKKYTGALIGIFDPGDITNKVLGDIRGSQLFAYLFRRFGYPNGGWDDYKEFVSPYLITAPMDAVFLSVQPYMGGDYRYSCSNRTELMFGYCVSQEIEKQLYAIPAAKHHELELYQNINKALEDAIRDLLRPVFIRDVPINCYGSIDDNDFEDLPEEVERCNDAGYGIPSAFFEDTDRYDKFIDAMIKLGNGDIGMAMECIIRNEIKAL